MWIQGPDLGVSQVLKPSLQGIIALTLLLKVFLKETQEMALLVKISYLGNAGSMHFLMGNLTLQWYSFLESWWISTVLHQIIVRANLIGRLQWIIWIGIWSHIGW